MQTAEAPMKIYEPKPSDQQRITMLAQSDAPVRIYEPQHGGSLIAGNDKGTMSP